MSQNTQVYTARCHCERVKIQFETRIDKVWTCNCSYCRIRDGHWIYLPQDDVTFVQGRDLLKEYRFNTHSSCNLFCRICAIHLICVPRVFPDKYAVRVECMNEIELTDVMDRVHMFDGLNWEANCDNLRALEAQGDPAPAEGRVLV